ncbi:cell envelope integrity protein TolA, partial [Klebsiella michiganensis]
AAKKAAAAKEANGVDDLLGDLSSGKNAPKGNTSGSAGGSSPAKGSKQGQGGASQAEINSYISQVQAAIKGHLYDWDTYKGKTCTLRVNLAQDGTLLSVKSEGGDPAFCQQMLAATSRMTKFPKPPSQAVYETFKNAPLDFKPQ